MTLTPPTSRDGAETALDWQSVEGGIGFENGWANFGAPYGDVQYALDSAAGRVYLRGIANPGTDGVGFTLPADYRPSVQRIIAAYMDGGAAGVEVLTTGVVNAFSGPTVAVSFDGCYFDL